MSLPFSHWDHVMLEREREVCLGEPFVFIVCVRVCVGVDVGVSVGGCARVCSRATRGIYKI